MDSHGPTTFENCYKRIEFVKENIYCSIERLNRKYLLLLATKLMKKKHVILVMLENTINHL